VEKVREKREPNTTEKELWSSAGFPGQASSGKRKKSLTTRAGDGGLVKSFNRGSTPPESVEKGEKWNMPFQEGGGNKGFWASQEKSQIQDHVRCEISKSGGKNRTRKE